jgi:hypothetical protein
MQSNVPNVHGLAAMRRQHPRQLRGQLVIDQESAPFHAAAESVRLDA